MKISIKICGISSTETLRKLENLNIAYIGFIFYERSKRYIDVRKAEEIFKSINSKIKTIGVFVDPSDNYIANILNRVPLSGIQLHGQETPNRIEEIKKQTNILTIKAIPIESKKDIMIAHDYENICDMLLFDGKTQNSKLPPGGNAIKFDWKLLNSENWRCPWFLSGGLNVNNVKEAIEMSNAKYVDVSSGVENESGIKDSVLIEKFVSKIDEK